MSFLTYEQYISSIKKENKEVAPLQSYDDILIKLGVKYAYSYKIAPQHFISSFVNNKSIQMASEEIVLAYKKCGAFAECLELGKDFTGYCNRFETLSDKQKKTMAEILLIIYSLNI